MLKVGAFHAKTHFSALLEKVEQGAQIIITKHGHPVAKLVPTQVLDHEKIKQTIEQIKRFGENNFLGDLDWKQLRDEGKK